MRARLGACCPALQNTVPLPLFLPSPAAAAEDFKWRFLTCVALAIPIVYLWEPVQVAFGLGVDKRLEIAPGIAVGLAAVVVLYGGWPFLAGAAREVRAARPGAMLLGALALIAGVVLVGDPGLGVDGRSLRALELVALVNALLLGSWLTALGARSGRSPRAGRRLSEVCTLLAVGAAAATVFVRIEVAGGNPSFALGRAAAVLAIASPMAILASYLRPSAVWGSSRSNESFEDYVVTHVLVPTGGSEDALLTAAATAVGDAAVVRASRRAAEQRGARALSSPSERSQLMTAPALREAGLEAPFDALNGLEESRTVVWVVERWRVTGALALEPRGAQVDGVGGDSTSRRGRLRPAPAIAYNLVALPIAAGVVPGIYPFPATAALISGLFAAAVAVLATRRAPAP